LLHPPSYLCKKYLGADYWGSAGNKLWELADDSRLTDEEKTCLKLTFDQCIVRKQDFQRTSDALKVVGKIIKSLEPGNVNHLDEIADDLIKLKDSDCAGACFIWTSVADDTWDSDRQDEDECCLKWDISKETDHWFLFSD